MNDGARAVVVGIDIIDADMAALRWAVAEAALREAPLRIVHSYSRTQDRQFTTATRLAAVDASPAHARAESVLDAAARRCRLLSPQLLVSCVASEGTAAAVLLAEARQASLVVIGSRKLDALGSLLLGSTGQAVAERAPCPVVVIGEQPPKNSAGGGRVVVGVNLDEDDSTVLAFGFAQARRHTAVLEVVVCWKPDLMSAASLLYEAVAAEQATVEDLLDDRLTPWRERFPDVQVSQVVLEQRPVAGLVARAAGQRLLVVGRRGIHPLQAPLLGAVNLGVLHRSQCPVAIVPTVAADAGHPHSVRSLGRQPTS
ncbi:MAG TPA: universal stress protein [Jatrophihabitans sp.]|jgi:nucleotide-binding universal stress UspA family protein|uniref:universal stress protein n=1 Tax=Jatrophihabitans sp. TaxID=1932789 RepID=UPI002F2498D0